VILRTLEVFTASFDLPDNIPHIPRYFDNLHLPEKSLCNAKACVFLIELGFFDFVAGVLQDFDRDTLVVSACIRFLYSVTAVMNIVHDQIFPYSEIVKAISLEHNVNTTDSLEDVYEEIMFQWKRKQAPPESDVNITVDLLFAAKRSVAARIIARGPQFLEEDTVKAAEVIVLEANVVMSKILFVEKGYIELAIRNVIR